MADLALRSPRSEWNRLTELPVLILSGGFGTRLRPAYDGGPKTMAPVDGRPFLWYLLRNLRQGGLHRVVLCTGYKHEQIETWAGNGRALDLDLAYSIESEPLGTAGALRLAVERYVDCDRFLAMNGDSFMRVDFAQMLKLHLAHKARATLALAAVSDTTRYGRVAVDEQGWVCGFLEKSSAPGAAFINGGTYIFQREIFETLPAGQSISLEREVLPALVHQRLLSFSTHGYFIDIGVPEDFARAQAEPMELFQP
jgi:NDP-sugar pyrophosphorylase family protein